MRDHQTGFRIPDSQKSEFGKKLDEVKEFEKRGGNCLFVIDEEGCTCENPINNNCHVIPESSVLGELKDNSSGKVLELRWGVSRLEHFFASSSETNPIDLNNTDAFEPQSVGTGDACVGWFACKDKIKGVDHDGEFGPIDVKEPDLKDPIVQFLCMYRAVLFTVDLFRLSMKAVNRWDKEARRHPDMGIRVKWTQLRNRLKDRIPEAKATASRLGKIWYGRKIHGEFDPATVFGQTLNFRSTLKFASSGVYGKGVVVTVVPVGEYQHKMGIFHLSEDADSMKEDKERLFRLTSGSEDLCNSGVEVLRALMTDGGSAIAASPVSYRGLPDAEKQTIRILLAHNSSADTMAKSLTSPRPQAKGRRSRR